MTTTGDGEFIIHTPAEKDLIPIVLHHYPICVTYALFNEGKIPVADPTALEERVSDASLVLAVNSYKELCCMHLTGVSLTSPSLIIRCSEMAAERSRRIVEFIKSTLEDDAAERKEGNLPKGFAECIKLSNIPSNFHDEEEIEEMEESEVASDVESVVQTADEDVKVLDTKTVASGTWVKESEEESSSSSEDHDEDMEVKPTKAKPVKAKKEPSSDDSSEEEETMVLK